MVKTEVIKRMVSYYVKYAQETDNIVPVDPAKKTEMLTYANLLFQQTEILKDAIIAGIQAGSTRQDARRYGEDLHDLAIRYRDMLNQDNAEELPELHAQMMQDYNILEDTYIGAEYDPMKKIKEALASLGPEAV